MNGDIPTENANRRAEAVVDRVLDGIRMVILREINKDLNGAIVHLQKSEPRWLNSTLYEIVFNILNLFQQRMEDLTDPFIDWYHPTFAFTYPIPFNVDWESIISGKYKKIRRENEKGKSQEDLRRDDLLLAYRKFFALQVITAGMIFEQKEDSGGLIPRFRSEIRYCLDIFHKELKENVRQRLCEPVELFDQIEVPLASDSETDGDVPGSNSIKLSALPFSMTLENEPVQGFLQIKIYPLIVDHISESAFHTVEAEIIFLRDNPDPDSFHHPYKWKPESRKVFWQNIQGFLQGCLGTLISSDEKQQGSTHYITGTRSEDYEKLLDTDQYIPIPLSIPQQTSMEIRNLARAIADGPLNRRWHCVSDEIALVHTIPGQSLQTKISAGPVLDWLNLPATYESLRVALQNFEIGAILLLHVVIDFALRRPQVTMKIDDLCRLIGFDDRGLGKREEARRKVWQWMLILDSMTIYGKRPGVYKDSYTKKNIDLTSSDALIRITGERFDKEMMLRSGEVPLEISWVAGPWLDKHRGDKRILQHYGDICKIAAIPSGKASGAWAQSIGLALNQLWRERASQAEVKYVGEENKITVTFKPFTRFQLLDLFRCKPWVGDVLNSTDPKRAREYWKKAIRILKFDSGVIGYYAELDEMPDIRKGWQDFWLNLQKLDIRPKEEGTQVVAELSRRSAKVRRRGSRKHKR